MLNYIWSGMIVISFVVAMFMGRLEMITTAAMDGAVSAVEMCIGLLGGMCLWTGIAKVSEKSGLTMLFAQVLKPITKIIFPKLKNGSAALNAIVANMVANLLGMGNAATPLGIAAMKELDKQNRVKEVASDEMCMFVVINTASIQLIPSTIIALRQIFGSENPTEIIAPVWMCSICAVVVGVVAAKIFQKRKDRK